ncbi:S1C family serine protease [Arthrobacter sp. GCM10027362]|uniref:S1C family serine protease n=1 Tax=Arthrobacter sp. GCM10027362 TaxID=3273379 RepID=UPI003634C267
MSENPQDPGDRPVPPQPQNPPSTPPAAAPAPGPAPDPNATRSIGPEQNRTQPVGQIPAQHGSWRHADAPAQGVPQGSAHPASETSTPGYGQPAPGAAFHTIGTGQASGPGLAYQQAKPATRKRFGTGTLVAGMLLAGLAGGGVAVGTQALADGSGAVIAPTTQSGQLIVNNTDSVNEITAAAAKASPSVVTISVTGGSSGGSGSGIILDGEGHILTNTHVVTLGGTVAKPSVEVRTQDGQVHKATIVGTDPLSDLAVIKINASRLTPVAFADSDKLNVGDTAIAIGSPLGLSGTVTDGIISTLNRTISVSSSAVPENSGDSSRGNPNDQFNFQFPGQEERQSGSQGSIYLNVMQTDAAINHGNSGGALVNTAGELIGVNVAIASSSEDSGSIGVGFAIPSNYAHRVAQELIADGKASHGYLGVTVTAKAAEDSSQFSVGAAVAEVVSGSPAADAGIRKGDVITAVENRPIEDSQSLTAAIREHTSGSKVTVTLLRDGSQRNVEVTLGETPAS